MLPTHSLAQTAWDRLFCSKNITNEINDDIRALGSFRSGWIDVEVVNSSRDYRVTAVSFRLEGSYNGREFRKFYERRPFAVEPDTSERLLIETDVPSSYQTVVEIDFSKITDFYGCKN
jgi:hypothetical protein